MSERPDTETAKTATTTQTGQPKTATGPGTDVHPTTAEKPGTGTEPKKDDGDNSEKKGKATFYGRDQYPDGYVMHHESSGSITLDNPDGTRGLWNDDEGNWMDMAGHPMPDGWDGGHKPGTAFGSGPSSSSASNP